MNFLNEGKGKKPSGSGRVLDELMMKTKTSLLIDRQAGRQASLRRPL